MNDKDIWNTPEVKQAEADYRKIVKRGTHEMLHAAQQRPGETDAERINRMADIFKITAHWLDKVDARMGGETNTVYEQEDWLA